jgi:hypothetical protein
MAQGVLEHLEYHKSLSGRQPQEVVEKRKSVHMVLQRCSSSRQLHLAAKDKMVEAPSSLVRSKSHWLRLRQKQKH